MDLRFLGAGLILIGCFGFGARLACSYSKNERAIRQLMRGLSIMDRELRFKLSPLSELCRTASQEMSGISGRVMNAFVFQLESRTMPDACSCMRYVLSQVYIPEHRTRELFVLLGQTLGRYDLDGQLSGLSELKIACADSLEGLRSRRKEYLRCHQTLFVCAGVSMIILFL